MRAWCNCLFIVTLILITHTVSAYPLAEKTPASGSAPLDLLSAQPDRSFIPHFGAYQNKYLFVIDTTGYDLNIIDLETWDTHTTQPDSFNATIADVTLLPDGTTLMVGLSDGNLVTLELDDEETFVNTEETTADDEDEEEDPQDSRQTDLADSMTSAGITFMVADPVDDILYMANDDGYFFQYNLNTLQLDEVLLSYGEIEEDEVTEEGEETTASNYYIPTAMVYAESSDGDKILITTTTGEVIVITPGGTGYTVYTLTSSATTFETTSPNLSDISLTPDGNYAYVVDSDNDLVWVFHVVSEQFIDQQSSGTSLDPIELEDVDDNNAFTHILTYSDAGGDVAYLAGANGLTLIDAETPGTATATKIIDPDTTTTGENPIALSGTPGPLITTSADTGYLFSINGDASISVLTDNPWITLSSISTDTVTTETASTFSLTFQSDTAGSYTIKANSDLTADSGTELIASTAFAEVDTDITTADIDVNSFARTSFVEGENKIFVFVTDVNSLLGHSAIILNVDRPPEPVTITGVSFGNRKAYVQFEASPDADIDHYVLYAEPAANQATPACPGALTFVSDNAITTNVSTSVCTDDTCEGTANNLTNDTAYCVAVSVVDESDQASALSAYTQSVTPEQTVGPAGYFGETSCSLNSLLHKTNTSPVSFVVLLGGLGLLLMTRFCSKEKCHPSVPQTGSVLRLKCWDPDLVKSWIPAFAGMTKLILILSLMSFSHSALAQERSPQHWTLEPKLSFWIPTDTAVRDFMGLCCHIGGEVEFGYLIKNQFNITATTGFSYDGGQSVGLRSGGASGDSYNLFFFPFRFDFLYRFDYKPEQLFLPYVRTGLDLVLFHETSSGASITNVKYGVHAGAGVGILLDRIEEMGNDLEAVIGVNDIYLTLEVRYAFLNSFASTGLDLSGLYPYVGVLFEF